MKETTNRTRQITGDAHLDSGAQEQLVREEIRSYTKGTAYLTLFGFYWLTREAGQNGRGERVIISITRLGASFLNTKLATATVPVHGREASDRDPAILDNDFFAGG